MKLKDALQLFYTAMIGNRSSDTQQFYRQILDTFPEHLLEKPISEIKIADLRAWSATLAERNNRYVDHPYRNEMPGGLSVWTRHGYIRACRRLFNWLVEEELLEESPAARLDLPTLPKEPPKWINDEDLNRLQEQACKKGPRDYAIVRFLGDTGCRLSGLTGLTLDDLDMTNREAIVREKGRGGRRKARMVYFSEKTQEALQAWLAVRPKDETTRNVFTSKRGGPLSGNGVYEMLERLAKKTDVQRFNPHSFRHAWARRALRRKLDLGAVSQILGHTSIKVTHEFYGFWDKGELPERHRLGQLD